MHHFLGGGRITATHQHKFFWVMVHWPLWLPHESVQHTKQYKFADNVNVDLTDNKHLVSD